MTCSHFQKPACACARGPASYSRPVTSLNPVPSSAWGSSSTATPSSARSGALGRRHPQSRGQKPAPVQRRHAPACDDRHRTQLPSQAAAGGRTHHRARRHHPGAACACSSASASSMRSPPSSSPTTSAWWPACHGLVMYAGRIVESGHSSRNPAALHGRPAEERATAGRAAPGHPADDRRRHCTLQAAPHAALLLGRVLGCRAGIGAHSHDRLSACSSSGQAA